MDNITYLIFRRIAFLILTLHICRDGFKDSIEKPTSNSTTKPALFPTTIYPQPDNPTYLFYTAIAR
ncbi:hypothetical protein [Coleofasciculus chthonoplastes]|uniref:hypothetical protein n=1 Tax=Coleofasciculus chthonoplastes TaxID=64178 RepID=UPI0012F75188|nr:hypothetical protein [Coleofasciculus chthonoplastes]